MIASLAFGVAIGGVAAWVGPNTLDALLVPLPLLAVVTPTLVVGQRRAGRWINSITLLLGTIAVLFVTIQPPVGVLAMLVAWVAALTAAVDLLVPTGRRRRGTTRAAIVTIAALGWLLWPIWLAPQLIAWQVPIPTWGTTLHPIFAINAAAIERGIWTEQPNAYALTPLGQDVSYALPESAWPTMLAHLAMAICLFCASFSSSAWCRVRRRGRIRFRRPPPPAP